MNTSVKSSKSNEITRSRLLARCIVMRQLHIDIAERLAEISETIMAKVSHERAPAVAARLRVNAAFAKAHGSRLKVRVVAMTRVNLTTVHQWPIIDDIVSMIQQLSGLHASLASRYEVFAQDARNVADLSTAWTCELNRTECENAAIELTKLADEVAGLIGQDEVAA